MMTTSNIPSFWEKARQELCDNDAVMAQIIAQYQGETLCRRYDAFTTLARSITGQQISVKAAESVWKKVLGVRCSVSGEEGRTEHAAPSTEHNIHPSFFIDAPEATLRAAGLSGQKVKYLKHIAENFANGTIDPAALHRMEDEEAIATLIKLKGVGRWTAEMFLIFHLLKPDVLPLADLGLQKAIRRHYASIPSLACGGGLGRGWGKIGQHQFTTRNELSLEKASELRNKPTDAEKRLWYFLRRNQLGGYRFRRQEPIGNFVTDFVCHEAKLIIELDGGQHTTQKEYDAQRTKYLERAGYQVLRFWNNDVLKNAEGVVETILQVLHDSPHPLPNPPPQAREGISTEDMLLLAEAWRPWRSVATWYLWRSLDPVPVEY